MKKNHAPRSVWRNPIHFLAFGFGSGAAPWAPGTFGTLMGVVIYLLLWQWLPLPYYAMLLVLAFIAGVAICHITARDLKVHDHGGIVWDEMLGYWLTLFAAPKGWLWIIIGFALFRLFDIWKPFPINYLDRRVHGGLGIMLDDVVAAIYAGIVLQILAKFYAT